jgi:type II secretory pathway component PulJ
MKLRPSGGEPRLPLAPLLRVAPGAAGRAGFALPAAVLVLAILSLLAVAAWESVRLEILASRALVASVGAFHAADGALRASLARGATPADTQETVGSTPVRVTVEPLLELEAGTLLRIRADGRKPGRPASTRRLELLVVRRTDGGVDVRSGSWRERF